MLDAGLGLGVSPKEVAPKVALPEPGRAVFKIEVLVAPKPAVNNQCFVNAALQLCCFNYDMAMHRCNLIL